MKNIFKQSTLLSISSLEHMDVKAIKLYLQEE